MNDPFSPEAALVVKLANIVARVEAMNLEALTLRSYLTDPQVKDWLAEMKLTGVVVIPKPKTDE